EPDLRGWNVVLADGRNIGRVVDLLIDTVALKVRSLECEVDPSTRPAASETRRIIIPIGYARLDEEDRTVHVGAISSADLDDLPIGRPDHVSADAIERRTESSERDEPRADDRFYDDPRFDPAEFYGWPRP